MGGVGVKGVKRGVYYYYFFFFGVEGVCWGK